MKNKNTKYYSKFQMDLKNSAPFVLHTIQALTNKGIKSWENHDKKYDIITTHGIKYEVKVDSNAIIWGRTGVEISSWDKPAGIMSTEAHYYVIYYPIINYILVASTAAIRLLKEENIHKIYVTGDADATCMALWPFNTFIKKLQSISQIYNLPFQFIKLSNNEMPQYQDVEIYNYIINKFRGYRNSINCKIRLKNDLWLNKFHQFVIKKIYQQNMWQKKYKINIEKSKKYEEYR